MFIGEYTHTIDQKGRMAVPAKFRAKLKQGAVVTRGLDNCLFLYSKEEWKAIAKKLANLPISKANARGFARLMLAGAMDVKIDSQGRILIPEYLRKYASFSKNIIIAGLYNRLEIWSDKIWNIYKQETESNAGEIAEKLGELGI
ncbi:cell division/cell wall cluster transcriptional repressor MraZ [bacterium]|nr:cell division/cell wall cluster transcriptional repressor MraZ [bacterium]